MASRLKTFISSNKRIFESISYLSVIQILTMLLPFLTYPYLIKIFGLALYGQIMLSQAVVSYVAIFVNFGFNISAAKSVSEVIDNDKEVNKLCSAIFIVKSIIWIFVAFIYLISVWVIIDDKISRVLYITAFTLTFNEFLVAQWFYQAKESLKVIAISSIATKLLNVILIFSLIHSKNDYYLVSLITGSCFLLAGIFSIHHMFKYHVRFIWPGYEHMIKVTRDSINLFLTSAIIAIKNKLDVILIGVFISNEAVAIYDFAQKILNILLLPITIINNAVFPKMNREKNKTFLKKLLFIMLSFSMSYTVIAAVILPFVMHYIFVVTHDSIEITRLLMCAAICFSLSLTLAQNGLIVFNYTKLHLFGMISTTLLYLTVMLIGYPLGFLNNVYYFVYTSLFLFTYEVVYRFAFCRWKNII
ncbi:oligosaccharide flippase family protein [Enterobacter hormaechei]